jgi:hypothetical protein
VAGFEARTPNVDFHRNGCGAKRLGVVFEADFPFGCYENSNTGLGCDFARG